MQRVRVSLSLTCVLALASLAQAQVFTPIGPSTLPTGMSKDGTWIAGWQSGGAFRWSAATGLQSFPSGHSGEPDVALGGSPVAVTIDNFLGLEEAALWTPTGTTFLGGLGQSYSRISETRGSDDSGSVVVGRSWIDTSSYHGFVWDAVNGLVDLGTQGGALSSADDVSGDGTLVVGWSEDSSGVGRPVVWSGGVASFLSSNPGGAAATNVDGSVVVGMEGDEAFRWTPASGLVMLGKLPGSTPVDKSIALDVSDDGNTIVGRSGSLFGTVVGGTPRRAFVWRPGAGMVEVEALVGALGGTIPAGFGELSWAVAVSADGDTIAGQSGLSSGIVEGWTFELPPVATTYCTAKVNSQGCLTAIGFDGTPSASSGSGFHVSATDIVPSSKGVLFYGTSGAAATPFQGGFLCVAPPTTRTSVQDSGGAGPCTGTFTFDFNAYVATGVAPSLVGGADVWAQYWSRDPASPSGTNLTDGVTFTLWP